TRGNKRWDECSSPCATACRIWVKSAIRPRRSSSSLQLFQQHLRSAAALFVFLATARRQIVRCAFKKTALGLEVGERLRRKREQFVQSHFPRLAFGKLNQLAANSLIFMG